MSKTSSSVKNRYNDANYDYIRLAVPKGEKDRWKQAAMKSGKSLTRFIHDCVNKELKG